MKTIGLIGGVSWTSTLEYYRRLNKSIYAKLGGFSSAKILMHSLNFAEILQYQSSNNIDAEAGILVKAAKGLERSGADLVLICSNTTNKTSSLVQNALHIPLLNLIEITAEKVNSSHIKCAGLIGTKYVMYEDFYKKAFKKFDIEVKVPDQSKGIAIHNIIYEELVKDIYSSKSKKYLLDAINELYDQGSEAVILGCTEIPLIISEADTPVKLFDTVQIHVDKAIEFALAQEYYN
jgi:aspartate racemase